MSNIPNIPHIETPITLPTGHIHPQWYQYLMLLNRELQTNNSEQGTTIPSQSSANIAIIEQKLQQPTLIYDSDLNLPKISVNGIFKTITTS